MGIKEKNLDLKLNKGHAVCFDFDGVIHKYSNWNDLKYIGVTNRKLPAQLYIDDRVYKYTGQTVKQFILDNSEED